MAHTPGPWRHETFGYTTFIGVGEERSDLISGDGYVAEVHGLANGPSGELREANARLIAAAPDLLAAAEAALRLLSVADHDQKLSTPTVDVLRAALAAAKGEA